MTDFSLWGMLTQASLVVMLVMLGLLLVSVVSWAIIFNKSSLLRRERAQAMKFEDEFWSGVELVQYYNRVRQYKKHSALQEIFCKGAREYVQLARNRQVSSDTISHTAERTMKVALAREADHLEMHLPFLATVGSTSPYVGLFGTVWGIINAFHSLDPGQGSAMLTLIAPGISEALVATAMGLFTAIPAVIAYNRFSEQADKLLALYSNFIEEFTTLLQREAMQHEEQKS